MKHIQTFESFMNESYISTHIGNIVEFVVPGTKIVHTGKVVKKTSKEIVVIDDKTGKEVNVPITAVAATYENK
jgi:hypothetical protein